MRAWPALDQTLMAQAAATFNFKLGHPAVLAIGPDGTVIFRRTAARAFVNDLYALAPDGSVRVLARSAELLAAGEQLSDAEKARRERIRLATKGIVGAALSDDGTRAMFALGGTIYVQDATGALSDRALADAYDPQLSPDGTAIAFVRDGDLHVHVIATEATTRLAQHADGFELGVADFAAQEEFGRARGFWWSPDSTRIAFARVDNRAMDTIYVADARHNDRPPVPFKYPRAGTPNARVDVGVVPIAGGDPRWFDLGLEYLVDVDWDAHGGLTALVTDRDQQLGRYLALETGKVLVEERDDAWLNFDAGHPTWLADGSGFLWMTESRGAWTLELHAPDGALVRPLTAVDFGLRDLVGVTGDAAIVIATTDPTRQDVWRVPLAGGAPVRLSDGDGVASASTRHGTVVVTSVLAAGGRATYAITGGQRRAVPSVAEAPDLVPTTVLETVELAGRTHHVAITRPRAFDPSQRYPVLVNVYGGPGKQMVDVGRDGFVMDQWYADAGFIVVRSDNRGSPGRDRAWSRAILRDLITVPLADQVDALHAMAARHRELDLARVGIFGWSFGGYVSTIAAALRPDVFHCAIAGAPVSDWALYDTAYTERYLKLPSENVEGYKHGSALTHAGALTRPLLIIHGITDDNVHFAHALALIEALYLAGKRAEVITLSSTHMLPDPALYLARERVQLEFFRQYL